MAMVFRVLADISNYAEKQSEDCSSTSQCQNKAVHGDTGRRKLYTSTSTWTSHEDHYPKQNHIQSSQLIFPASKSKIMSPCSIIR